MPDKASGKTSKIRNSANDKIMKYNKNTVSKEKVLLEKKPKKSAVKEKPNAIKVASKEPSQLIIEIENNSNNTELIEMKGDKPTSKREEKISSDLDRKTPSYLEPYDEDILFLSDRHKSIISDVVSCLKSNSPFCFLGSELASYREYYKEIVIDHLKIKEKIELLYFDPKFGDDLSVIINSELEGIDISLVGALNSSIRRKILIIDNENYTKNLDWELIDSLRLELKAVNIGVFGVAPTFSREKAKAISVASNFKNCYFPALDKAEIKELNEYISKDSCNANHLETLNSLLVNDLGKGLSARKFTLGGSGGFWHTLRKYFARK